LFEELATSSSNLAAGAANAPKWSRREQNAFYDALVLTYSKFALIRGQP
jgi:hypothetical protein